MMYLQYNHAERMIKFLELFKKELALDMEEYITCYLDLDTCNKQGLENWGRILLSPRKIKVPSERRLNTSIGFTQKRNPKHQKYPANFTHGNFYNGAEEYQYIADAPYRALLKMIYAIYTTRITLVTASRIINEFCISLNKNQKVIIKPSEKDYMHWFFIFTAPLEPRMLGLLRLPNIMPVPVCFSYEIITDY